MTFQYQFPSGSSPNTGPSDFRDHAGSNVNQALTELTLAQRNTKDAVEALVCRVTAVEEKCKTTPFTDWLVLDQDHVDMVGVGFMVWLLALGGVGIGAVVASPQHPKVIACGVVSTLLFALWTAGIIVMHQLQKRSK